MSEINASFDSNSIISYLNTQATQNTYDFAVAQYDGTEQYYKKLDDTLKLAREGYILDSEGKEIDLTTPAGALILDLYLKDIDSAWNIVMGITKQGLTLDGKLWKMGG